MNNNMNVRIVEASYVRSEEQFCGCTRRKCAMIASWVLVFVRAIIFLYLFGRTILYLVFYQHPEEYFMKYGRGKGIVLDIATGEVSQNDDFSKLNARLFGEYLVYNLCSAVDLGFSILLFVGVYKKSTNFILAWIMYFITSTGINFLFIVWYAEKFTTFDKLITIKLIVLSFTIFFGILCYYKELRDLEGEPDGRNKKEIKVTIVDPMHHNLQPHINPQLLNAPFQNLPEFSQLYDPYNVNLDVK